MDTKGQLLKTGHKETPDLTIKRKKYKMDLIPPALVVARYFAAEQANVEDLQATREAAARELDEFVEEHTSSGVGEEGLVIDATNEKGNVTKRGVVARLRTIQEEAAPDSDEERDALMRCLVLLEAESNAVTAVKEAPRPHSTKRSWPTTLRLPKPGSRRWSSRTSGSRVFGPPLRVRFRG